MALRLLSQVGDQLSMDAQTAGQYLTWAARLHEIGISIAHSGYHKHSAYIVEYADMPGFSTMEQKTLALLMRGQRRSLNKFHLPGIEDDRCLLVLILRLSILFHRNRMDDNMPQLALRREEREFRLTLQKNWLEGNPLTKAELANEEAFWQQAGISLILTEQL
jgi:exopolyphosphatase/guanosine-5'-triphosphate,3'-diphosphate pyrophosphatase